MSQNSETTQNYKKIPRIPLDGITFFNEFGEMTRDTQEAGIRYLTNEFWTSGQRQGHSLHEISYRACFKSELPAFFISRFTRVGDLVHDPFMGRGTTPLQAVLMGRAGIGSDVNPLSTLLVRPRLNPPTLHTIAARLREISWDKANKIKTPELLAFYGPRTLSRLEMLRDYLLERAPVSMSEPDSVNDWIRMVSLNRLTGHSPGFFSGRTMPPNQAVTLAAQIKINTKLGTITHPERDIAAIILKKSRSLLRDGVPPNESHSVLSTALAHATPSIADGSVSLVLTSPPFLDVVQYASDNWLRCWFAGIDPDAVSIAMHKDENAWLEMVRNVLCEQARILRSGGHVAFEVGEVRGGKVLLERLVWQAAETLPFDRLAVVVNDQNFTKTANCWGVSNGSKGTNTNRIVILRRQ